jgi:hypothetical protein
MCVFGVNHLSAVRGEEKVTAAGDIMRREGYSGGRHNEKGRLQRRET